MFCGLFPVDAAKLRETARCAAKLHLNDASFDLRTRDLGAALGFGFRCGFLGLLHLEIIRERLDREFDLDLITTAPSVIYHVYMSNGTDEGAAQSGRHARSVTCIDHIEEPWIKATILVPDEYLGGV